MASFEYRQSLARRETSDKREITRFILDYLMENEIIIKHHFIPTFLVLKKKQGNKKKSGNNGIFQNL